MNILFVASFFTYASILALVGLYVFLRQKSSAEFMVGDRSINYWVTAIATHATDMSAWLFMAFPGYVYAEGIFRCWIAIGLFVCMFLSWHFIAKKIRLATEKFQSLTLSSYFEKRFNDTSGWLRITSAVVALFFFTLYISAGIVALGRALSVTFEFSYHTGITLGTLTVALYTILGGFVAIAWNDFMQGMFVFFILICFPFYAVYTVGGFAQIAQAAHLKNISLALLPDYSYATITGALLLAFSWGIGYFGQPHILVNFMGIDNPKDIWKAKWVGLSWQAITLTAATIIGLAGIPFFKPALVGKTGAETVFINMVKMSFNPLLAGFILCAILAAAITTMDSQILVSASMLTQDIYKKIFHRKATSRQLLTISRISGIAIICLSFYFALENKKSILELVEYAWYGLGSAFGPLVILSLYSNKVTRNGALAGILTGGLVAGIWPYLNVPLAGYSILPGFVLSFLAIVLVSLFDQKNLLSPTA